MQVKNPKFMISAVKPEQYPKTNMLEIAFAGRSNCGKSSLINALVGRKNLAFSGKTQGKTRQINFYNLDNELIFVDLPGYGFANVSGDEQRLWSEVVDSYLNVRDQLYLVLLLMDVRHDPSKDDMNMYAWAIESGLEFRVVLTKADKLSKAQLAGRVQSIKGCLGDSADGKIVTVSSEKGTGVRELWGVIDKIMQD